jgi:hypothetical protein
MKETTDICEVSVSIEDLIKRLSSAGDGRFSDYAIESISTRVFVEDVSVSNAINELLQTFALYKPKGSYQIEAHAILCDAPPEGMKPPKSAEILENPGVLQYYAAGDLRFVEAPSVGWSIADVKKKKIIVAALKEPRIKTWHVAHHLFYPLWVQLMKTHDIFALHAAGIIKDGVGMLFPAYSGSGKSVLSLNMVKEGCKLLSDDTVFLREVNGHITAIGYPEKINLRREAIDLFSDLPVIDPGASSSWKACVDIESLFPGCFVNEAIPQAVVLIERNGNIDSKVETVSRAEALAKLFKYSLFFIDSSTSKQNFRIVSKLAEQSKCFSLDIGTDLNSLISAVNEIVCRTRG